MHQYGEIIPSSEILSLASEGKCVSKIDQKVIFSKYTAPGDIADLKVLKSKKQFIEAALDRIISPSPFRTTPACQHFGTCGGCLLQHLQYPTQLEFKSQQVIDALERIGHLTFPKPLPILGSEASYRYRNKMDYSFSNKRWLLPSEIDQVSAHEPGLGFHISGRYDKVLDIAECHLQAEPGNAIRNLVRALAIKNGWSFYDLKEQKGFLRNLIIRNTIKGEFMVILQVGDDQPEDRTLLLNALAEKFPQITSLLYIINPKKNETFQDLEVHTFKGLPYIEEEMEGLRFRIGPKTFYQTNPAQAYRLYAAVRDLAGLKGDELVYDLYTGAGTIALFMARYAKEVVGVEYVPQAIEDAKVNASLNGLTNTRFFAGDMKKLLTSSFIEEQGKPDVIITDPPRAGMDEAVVMRLLETLPSKIIYVSCNPATQARDIALMNEQYSITAVLPVDQFPQTAHVESIVSLTLRTHA
jgi:23S rRNA (uracil1939-C5)-methyltransferase